MKLVNCAICNKKHEAIETNLCEKCTEKYVESLTKIMSKKDADNLIWLIGGIDQGSKWNTEEIVKQQAKLDELNINFKKHDHKDGKLVRYL